MQIKPSFGYEGSSFFRNAQISISGAKRESADSAETAAVRIKTVRSSAIGPQRTAPHYPARRSANTSDSTLRKAAEQEARLGELFDRSKADIFSGKTEDELFAMAVNSVNMRKIQHSTATMEVKTSSDGRFYTESVSSTVIAGEKGMTQEELIAEAAGVAESGGLDFTFNKYVVKAEVSRAIQVGGANWTSYATNPSSLAFDLQLQNMAAYRAFYNERAEASLTGGELEATMKMLDEEFAIGLDTVVSRFTKNDKAVYMQADLDGVKQSIETIYNEFTDYYSNLIRDGQFDAGIPDESSWLKNCAVYVTGKLRNFSDARDDIADAEPTAAKYGISDLQAMRIMSEVTTASGGSSTREENIGIDLGMDAIKLKMFEMSGISDACKNQMQQSFEIKKELVIAAKNETIAWQRDDYYRQRGYSYDRLDEDVIDSTIKTMLTALEADSLSTGIENAISTVLEDFEARQQAQYESGNVQARYKALDETKLEKYRAQGESRDELRLRGMGYSKSSLLGFHDIAAFNTMAKLFEQPSWYQAGKGAGLDLLV